jgi:hypothetical protein
MRAECDARVIVLFSHSVHVLACLACLPRPILSVISRLLLRVWIRVHGRAGALGVGALTRITFVLSHRGGVDELAPPGHHARDGCHHRLPRRRVRMQVRLRSLSAGRGGPYV